MTNRERIVRTLRCEPTDRPPFPLWLGFQPWGETLARWQAESGIGDLKLASHFGFDPYFRQVPAELGPLPHFEPQVLEESPEFVVTRDWRGIAMRNRRDGGSMPDFLAHPVQCPADWRRYKAERLQPLAGERLPALPRFLLETARDDVPIQAGCFPWGVFGTARDLLGAEALLLAFRDEPDMVRDIMRSCTDVWLAVYEEIVKAIRVGHIHIWEDMSGKQGSLISMAMVEEFMMPQYDRIAAFARQHGIPLLSVDSDGLVDELLPVMMAHGVNAFMPFEVQAGNDTEDVRRRYPRLGICGGLDKSALAKGRPAIHRELDKAERLLAQGGYIVGFDHLIPPDVPWDSYQYAVTHLRKMIFG
jgi:uroporphyrinogen decarboxylase